MKALGTNLGTHMQCLKPHVHWAIELLQRSKSATSIIVSPHLGKVRSFVQL